MKKRMLAIGVLLMLVFNSLGVAVDSSEGSDCNWWCKIKAVFEGNVVGE